MPSTNAQRCCADLGCSSKQRVHMLRFTQPCWCARAIQIKTTEDSAHWASPWLDVPLDSQLWPMGCRVHNGFEFDKCTSCSAHHVWANAVAPWLCPGGEDWTLSSRLLRPNPSRHGTPLLPEILSGSCFQCHVMQSLRLNPSREEPQKHQQSGDQVSNTRTTAEQSSHDML